MKSAFYLLIFAEILKMKFSITILFVCLCNCLSAQVSHAEENMLKDTGNFLTNTSIGGYGNAFYQRDFNQKISTINFERFVLFFGHKFSDKFSFLSEVELEDAKVEGEEEGGEISIEQCYVRFNLNKYNYIVGGLFLPRIGILNENHFPTSFNGNERTQVETFVLPSTWRELGVGLFGSLKAFPLNYSIGIMNGLNSGGFEHGTLIREGRFEGKNASANNLAITGALQIEKSNLKLQVSGYFGGSVGLNPRQADSLKLTSGMFGTPVSVFEASVQYSIKGLSLRVLGSMISIPDASDINRAYASNTPEGAYGAYAEAGYDLLNSMKKNKQLIIFVRYEKFDLNSTVPANGIEDGTLVQQHIVAGLTYLPIKNVVLKADVRLKSTDDPNPALIINPSPVAPAYQKNNTFLNLGIGYSF